MMRPEGYRKTIRLMELANKFNIPIISIIDTPGAYPGVGAEERGQAEAIAKSIECCMKLTVPTISIIIGEGGSGGAIALASSNKVIMLQNAIYSVISPEGCATILWRDPKKTLEAATAMKMSSKDLLKLDIIDEIIPEPVGGAHRDKDLILDNVRNSLEKNLEFFNGMEKDEILNHRKNKFLSIGRSKGFSSQVRNIKKSFNERKFNRKIKIKIKKENKIIYIIASILFFIIILYINFIKIRDNVYIFYLNYMDKVHFYQFFLKKVHQIFIYFFFTFLFLLHHFSTIFKLNKILTKSFFNLLNKISKRVNASFLYSTKGSLCPYDLNPITCLNCSRY